MASSDSESYQSEDLNMEPINCLIKKYPQNFNSVGEYWTFIKENDQSKLDMFEIFARHGHHGYIRIINYFRSAEVKKFPTTNELLDHFNKVLCNDIKYLKGTLESDNFIIYSGDLEKANQEGESSESDDMPDLIATEECIEQEAPSSSSKSSKKKNKKKNNKNKNKNNGNNNNNNENVSANANASSKTEDTDRLKELLQATIISDNAKNEKKLKKMAKNSESKKFDKARDDDYFDGYGDLSIHVEMISDYSRTETYRKGIEDSGLVKDKIVLDVGAGSGILSMFAARAGAKHVYAIEPSAVATDAQEIISENGLGDKITIVRKLSEDLTLEDLDGNKPDVIISEWMGYFLYFEGMLPSVIKARQFFGNTALMLPQKCTLNLGLLTHQEYYDDIYKKWTDPKLNPWGFKFSPLARYQHTGDSLVDTVPHWQVTGDVKIHELDCNTADHDDVDFHSKFKFTDLKGKSSPFKIYGVVGWFSTNFTDKIVLDTSPKAENTHWRQTIFLFKKPVDHAADELEGSIDVRRLDNNRDLDIRLKIPSKKINQTFMMD